MYSTLHYAYDRVYHPFTAHWTAHVAAMVRFDFYFCVFGLPKLDGTTQRPGDSGAPIQLIHSTSSADPHQSACGISQAGCVTSVHSSSDSRVA